MEMGCAPSIYYWSDLIVFRLGLRSMASLSVVIVVNDKIGWYWLISFLSSVFSIAIDYILWKYIQEYVLKHTYNTTIQIFLKSINSHSIFIPFKTPFIQLISNLKINQLQSINNSFPTLQSITRSQWLPNSDDMPWNQVLWYN